MASRTLQDWQNYISDYQQKLAAEKVRLDAILADPSKTAAEKEKALNDYYRNQIFLQELQAKYNEFSQTGEVPDEVTFGGGDPNPVLIYKSDITQDTIHHGSISTSWGGSGDLSHAGDEVPIGSIFTSDLLLISAKVVKTDYGASQQTDVSFSGPRLVQLQSGYDWYCDANKNLDYWTKTQFNPSGISITMYEDPWSNGNARPLIRAYWGSVTNPVSINQGSAFSCPIVFTLLSMLTNPEGTVDGDSPWDYYDKIKPSVNPDNNLYPDGYEPPGPGNDPDDDPEEDMAPDKQDWGDPMQPNNGFSIPYAFANYIAFNEAGLRNFAERLWDAPDSFWEALSVTNRNSANWLDYFISLRAYPYWVNSTGTLANIYVGAGGKFYLGDVGTDVYASAAQHITYFTLDFEVPKYYNNFLDFAPYTKAEIYLPFSGTWEVNPKFLYHSNICISLKLDITDGSGVWQVFRSPTVEETAAGPQYMILEKQCKIGVEIPLSGLNATTMASNIVNASLASQQRLLSTTTQLLGDATSGNVGKFMADMAQVPLQSLTDSVNLANANREIPTASGGMSGLAAANCNVIPSITLIRPVVENPESFPHTVGNLVNKASKLEKLDGFTTCRNVDVSNVPQATDKEKAELKRILEGGFYSVAG